LFIDHHGNTTVKCTFVSINFNFDIQSTKTKEEEQNYFEYSY